MRNEKSYTLISNFSTLEIWSMFSYFLMHKSFLDKAIIDLMGILLDNGFIIE